MRPAANRHVLMTADAVGGVWTYALDLSAGLIEAGHRVTLAMLGPALSAAQAEAAGRLTGLTLAETGLPLDWADEATPNGLEEAGRHLADLAGRVGADLVHLNSPILAASAGFALPVVGACHSCLATWWDSVRGGALPEAFAWRTRMLAQGIGACDVLLAPSRSFAAATVARYGRPVRVVRNGRASLAASALPRQPVALASGRLWDEGKGLVYLDRAAGRMRHRVEAAGATEGPNGASIALRHAVPLGQLTPAALRERLARSSAYVSTALYEPFGLGVLEAAEAGCALVLSDIATFRELWDGAAIFVDPADEAALATVLDGLLGEPERARDLGACAKTRAGDYGLRPMIEGTLALYAEVLGRASNPSEAAA